jgi:hypothetical protein
MTERVLVLAAHDRDSLSTVRVVPGLRVGEAPGQLWLRGLPAVGELPIPIRALPAVEAYRLDAQDRLFPTDRQTPTGLLPLLSWQSIREFMPLEVPTAALPARQVPRYSIRLVASARAEPGAALLTTLTAWHDYVSAAPEIRLAGLRFAVSARQQVLVVGQPLPPMAGQEYWLQHNLLLPAGYDFEAPLLAPLLAQKLNPAGEALLLFTADGSWEQVSWHYLLPVTRSGVRLTTASFRHESSY